jgi:fucose permease
LFVSLALAKFPRPVKSASEQLRAGEILKLLGHPIAVTYFFAIFFYVGAEVGTASWIVKFFQQVHGLGAQRSLHAGDGFLLRNLPALPALTVSLFWGLQGLGRLTSGPGIQKIGPRWMLRLYAFCALASLVIAIFAPAVIAAIGFAACGFFTSVLFTLVFSGAVHSFPQAQGTISGLLITASIGGAVVPPLVGFAADHLGLQVAMAIPVLCFAFVFAVSLLGKAAYE